MMARTIDGEAGAMRRLARLREHRLFGVAVRVGGALLVLASAAFLVVVALQHRDAISGISLASWKWMIVAALAAIYGLALFLLGLAWHWMLVFTGAAPTGAAHSVRAHTLAQLAKYVPGNVFHLVGRHMIHRRAGMDHKRLALAALLENAMLVLAAACVVIVCLAMGGEGVVRGIALIAAMVALVTAGFAGRYLLRRFEAGLRPLLMAFAASTAFFAVMALIIVLLGNLVGAEASLRLGGGGVAAWIAGFVTPGAPGGLGIREAVMVIVGGDSVPTDRLLVIALLFRAVTFCGDVICALLSRLLLRDPAAAVPASAV